jgi:hypothetical protein
MAAVGASTSVLLNDLQSWTIDGTVFLKLDPSTARNIFTTSFLILNVLIAIVGEYFLKRRNQRRLILRSGIQAKRVPFALLTPWLSLTSCATYLWKTRRLPGGLLGLLMLASGIFGLVQHYMVNSFILPLPLPTWCEFETGIITTSNSKEIQPTPAWPASLLVFQAHSAVSYTKGQIGIYDKINSNTINFQPTTLDILGTWNCTQVKDSTIQPADWANTTSLQSYLNAQNFLDPSTESVAGAFGVNGSAYQGFMAWSGIFDKSVPYTAWEVQATIANGLNGTSPMTASNFRCSLVKDVASWTPTPMPTNETLTAWKDFMFGFVSQVAVSHYDAQLTTILNAMSMLAGSGNQNNLGLPTGANPFYGCVLPGALIHVAVYLVGILLFVIFLCLLVADLYALIRYRINKRRKVVNVEEIPTDLISWQLNMLRRMTKNKKLQTKDLHKYVYVYSQETGECEFTETMVCLFAHLDLWLVC